MSMQHWDKKKTLKRLIFLYCSIQNHSLTYLWFFIKMYFANIYSGDCVAVCGALSFVWALLGCDQFYCCITNSKADCIENPKQRDVVPNETVE